MIVVSHDFYIFLILKNNRYIQFIFILSAESHIVGLNEKQKDVEYDESHMIQVRCGNSIINDTLTAVSIEIFRSCFNS